MPTTSMTIASGRLSVGLTSASLTAFDCQVVAGAVIGDPKTNTRRASFCEGETQSGAASGFHLDVTVLQDWSDAAGVCWFAFDNDGERVFWELALDDPDTAGDVTMHGEADVAVFQFGGDAGTPLEGSASWAIPYKPLKGKWVGTFAASADADAA